MMQDFDMEELEARLYGQVFHSAPDESIQTPATTNIGANQNDIEPIRSIRQVSIYSVSNNATPHNKNRYWNSNETTAQQTTNNVISVEKNKPVQVCTLPLQYCTPPVQVCTPPVKACTSPHTYSVEDHAASEENINGTRLYPRKVPHIKEYVLLSDDKNRRNKNKIKRAKKKAKKKMLFQNSICNVCCKKPCFCNNRCSNLTTFDNNFTTDSFLFVNKQFSKNLNETGDQNISLLNPYFKTIEVAKKAPEKICPEVLNSVIIISDSDDDSIQEVPLPPQPAVPVLVIESDSEEITNNKGLNKAENDAPRLISLIQDECEVKGIILCEKIIDIEIDKNEKCGDIIDLSSSCELVIDESRADNINVSSVNKNDTIIDNQINFENTLNEPNKCVSSQNSAVITEKERNDLLCTPDSAMNDFIDNDIDSITISQFGFDFNLHGSDLDLTGREFLKPTPVMNHPTDIYDTESSCSGTGTPTKATYSDLAYGTPGKEIFGESDLNSFSKFITPNRTKSKKSTKNKIAKLKQVKTKASTVLRSFSKKSVGVDACKENTDLNFLHCDTTDIELSNKSPKKKNKRNKTKQLEHHQSVMPEEEIDVVNILNDTNSDVNIAVESDDGIEIENSLENKHVIQSEKQALKKNKKSAKKRRKMRERESEINFNKTDNSIVENTKRVKDDKCKSENQNNVEDKISEKNTNDGPSEKVEENNEYQNQCEDNVIVHDFTTETIELSDDDFDFDAHFFDQPPSVAENSVSNLQSNFDSVTDKKCNFVLNLSPTREPSTSRVNDEACSSNFDASQKNMVPHPFLDAKKKNTFGDFWTENMEAFYDDSWGQENFDLNAVINSMSSDVSKWKVITEDKQINKNHKRRIFCLRCKEQGHYKYECTTRIGPIKCSTCGGIGHFHSRCPNLGCTTCGIIGGYHTTSCNNCAHFSKIKCNICRMFGHPGQKCPDLWRRYHLTTAEESPSQLATFKLKPVDKQWCSGCARQGHLYHGCKSIYRDHFPTLPQIVSYEATYNNALPKYHIPEFAPRLPDPQIPYLNNMRLSSLNQYKESIMNHNNKKYGFMIKSLIRRCEKGASQYLTHVRNLEKDLQRNNFDSKKIASMYKLKSLIRKQEELLFL